MKLRDLELKDAPFMYEWMKDESVTCWFRFRAESITMDSVQMFILKNNNTDLVNFHYAIVDDNDEYLGTVSLKNVNYDDLNAEYAIVLRKLAQGKGAASFATKEIQKIAFDELGLHRLYLNVLSDNEHAWKLYEHWGFIFEGESIDSVRIRDEYKSLRWYRKLKSEYIG